MAARTAPISGFPEWLPSERRIEQYFLDVLREVFELHGYASIETRAVEPLDQLLRQGETSKEVYLLSRLQDEQREGREPSGSDLGLHFDMTVPFARYVAERSGHLQFPFRRYQIQKAWRGERPQEGRYREFLQADVDIVGRGSLPFFTEVDTMLVAVEALHRLPLPPVRMRVNNRKVPEGYYRGLGLDDPAAVLRIVDKLDKIGPDAVAELLVRDAGATDVQAKACLRLAEIRGTDASFADAVRELGVVSDLLDEGLDELSALIEAARHAAPGMVEVDLSVARGLDYYTGTVYETTMEGFESLGSVCSGGRYDNLVTVGGDTYPGVGMSIGVTRLLGPLLARNLLQINSPTATRVLVAVTDEDSRAASTVVASALRARGIATEVSPEASKFGKQIRYADRRGIPYVWFPGADGEPDQTEPDQVRDIRTGEQAPADPAGWELPAADRTVSVTYAPSDAAAPNAPATGSTT